MLQPFSRVNSDSLSVRILLRCRKFHSVLALGICIVLLASCVTAGNGEGGSIVTLDTAIREAASDIENRLSSGEKIALLSFSSPSERFSEYVLEELSVCLVNGSKLVVVDRKELDLIRQEERFQLSGEVSDESAKAIGKKLGAQYIVTGSLSSLGKSYRFRVKTLTVETAAVTASAALNINAGEEKVIFLLAGTKPPTEKEPVRPEEHLPEGLLYEVIGWKSITITNYIGTASNVSIPALIGGLPVTVIGEHAFSYCESLVNITIPSSVTAIGDWAFFSASLTSVTIPSSVATIGERAFAFCKRLTSITIDPQNSAYMIVNGVLFDKAGKTILCYPAGKTGAYTIPSSVTAIGNGAFFGCEGLTNIIIPWSVTAIGDGALTHCTGLTSLIIPSSVTAIGDGAFFGCDSLTSITIPSSVTAINDDVFAFCKSLKSVTIPSSVTTIGDAAFLDCSSLTSITIPSSVTAIGKEVFRQCRGLTSITIPLSVTTIGDGVFYGCDSLMNITLDPRNSAYMIVNGVLFDKAGKTLLFYPRSKAGAYTIPSSVTSMSAGAFYGCTSLTSVIIPSSVTAISEGAFYGCTSLTSVTIPSSVTTIGDYAFCGCTSLTSVTIPSSVTTIGEGAFLNNNLTTVTLSRRTRVGEDAFDSGVRIQYRD